MSTPQPWGLGTEHDKFRALMVSEMGEREFDRLTASEAAQGERSDLTRAGKTSSLNATTLPHRATSAKRRAINRAPAIIQKLYDADLLAVDLAAKFGPKATLKSR